MNIFESENELIRGLAKNKADAVEAIYRECFGAIQAYIIKNNGYADDARDIFQEAIIVLFENAQSESFELTCSIKTYLYSVSRRLWLKKVQREKRSSATSLDVLGDTVSVEDDLEVHQRRDENLNLLDVALDKLGEPCKSLLRAFYIEKKSMPEIASDFGYTNADNAKTQKYKCLVRLKKIFFTQHKNGD